MCSSIPIVNPIIQPMLFVEDVEWMSMPLQTTLAKVTGNPPKLVEELSPEARVYDILG
jgi:hypothetical protein